jgi:hypothetical protein
MTRLLLVMLIAPASALAQAPATNPPACASPEHRQFDFWVGSWDVYAFGKDKLVAHSLIERLYDGCAIRENWMPLKGTAGGSLNAWVPDQKKWHQTWVDASNSHVMFEGGMVGGKMVLTGLWRHGGGPGVHQSYRMTYSREAKGAVRQHGEITPDGGRTWQTSFDFLYVPSGQAVTK